MLIDLLNSQNYILVNMDAIQLFGLNTAVYCAELLNVYKKAVLKKKIINEKFFKIDRKFIEERTSLTTDTQLKCDLNLSKVGVIEISQEDPSIISLDVETFTSLLASEDVKLLDKVAKKVQVSKPKGISSSKKEYIIANLKNNVKCSNAELLGAIYNWIDTICTSGKGYLSNAQVSLFKDTLDQFSRGDLDLALDIVKIATIHGYRDCQWAINTYNKNIQMKQFGNSSGNSSQARTTIQTKTRAENLGDIKF